MNALIEIKLKLEKNYLVPENPKFLKLFEHCSGGYYGLTPDSMPLYEEIFNLHGIKIAYP